MKTKFNCAHCNAAIEAEAGKAGMAGDCPKCGQSLVIPSCPIKLKLGSYQGTWTKTTGKEPVVSRLTLTIARQEQQTVHGTLNTTGALDVDLEFSGTVADNQIQFVTTTLNKKLKIEWFAEIQDGFLRGTFSATNSGFWASVFGNEHQHGKWQCRKERFPIIGRLKSFAEYAFGLIIFLAIIGGVIAISNSESTPSTPSVVYIPSSAPPPIQSEPLQTSYQPSYNPPYRPSYPPQQPLTGFDKFCVDHQQEFELALRGIMWGLEQKSAGTGNTNPSQVWHFNSDGSGGHWQTAPNRNPNDNFSTHGNVNPHTGERGSK